MENSIFFAKLDMNSPMSEGRIVDKQKIEDGVVTISWCFKQGAHVVIAASHQGRKKEDTLENHIKVLENFFPKRVKFCKELKDLPQMVKDAKEFEIILLENIRNRDEEKEYKDVKKTELYTILKEVEKASGRGLVYVKDDMPVCHRKDLSVYGLPMQLKKEGYQILGGPLIEREMENIKTAIEKLERSNILCVWGGAKFDDYVHLFGPFFEKYRNAVVLTSGPLSVLFLKAYDKDIGENEAKFKIDSKLVKAAKGIIEKYDHGHLIIPRDYYVENGKENEVSGTDDLKGIVVDIGPKTIEFYKDMLKKHPNSLIISNGPLGQYEKIQNAKGTIQIYREVFNPENNNFVIGGGGDFNAVMRIMGYKPNISSSGGKAFLELLIHGTLPGFEPLEK